MLTGFIALSGTNVVVHEPPNRQRSGRLGLSAAETASAGGANRIILTSKDVSHVEAVQVESRWRDYVTGRLGQLTRGDGDFSGLTQPTVEVLEKARHVSISLFPADVPAPSVIPTEEGGVSFVW